MDCAGFGVRVRPVAISYVVVYRAGAGRGAPVRRYTIGAVGKIAPEQARARAKAVLGSVAHGHDPAGQKTTERGVPTIAELADQFMAEHVEPKRKAGTAGFYRDILYRLVRPAISTTKADKLTRQQVGKLHSSLADTPFQANRVLAVVGSMYAFAARAGVVPEGTNPARGIEKFKESCRERFLTAVELERLGSAIREAETTGIPWTVDCSKLKAKHLPKSEKRFTKINPFAAAAIRLLTFPGHPNVAHETHLQRNNRTFVNRTFRKMNGVVHYPCRYPSLRAETKAGRCNNSNSSALSLRYSAPAHSRWRVFLPSIQRRRMKAA